MNLARLLAYADNTFLQGGPEPTMRAFQALTALAAFLKLFPQPGKCAVYSAYAALTTARRARVPRRPSGRRHSGRHPGLPCYTRGHLCRPCMPPHGRPASCAPSGAGPLAPPSRQRPMTGGTPATGKSVDPRRLGGPAGRKQDHGWLGLAWVEGQGLSRTNPTDAGVVPCCHRCHSSLHAHRPRGLPAVCMPQKRPPLPPVESLARRRRQPVA
jgi:hypothetical protein